MSSTKNKTETKSKVDTCCSEPAKRKLLIKIGVGVGVATVLLVVIIAVAVVMATKPEDESSNPTVAKTEPSGINDTSQTSPTTTVTPPPTTEKASIVSVVDSLFEADVTSVISRSSGSPTVMESIALEEEINTQWIYYQTDDYAVYIIQKFNQGSQTIVAMTRGADDLKNNYNSTVLFCEEASMEGQFLSAAKIQESQPTRDIIVSSSTQPFEAPSVILPLRTDGCHQLPGRLRYKSGTVTRADMLGPTCSSLLGPKLDSVTSNKTFPGDMCITKTSMVEACQCYKQCLDCTSGSSPGVPSCQCVKYMQSDVNRISCSGTEDDVACVQNRDSFKEDLDGRPCSCSFGVYFAYPCGQEPGNCQGSECKLKWCLSGFTYKSPAVAFPKMCQQTDSNIKCT